MKPLRSGLPPLDSDRIPCSLSSLHPEWLLALALGAFLVACGGGSGGSGTEEVILPPNPEGVLLEGDPTALAIDVLQTMLPSPIPPEELNSGLMTTRLEAAIHPEATVGEVNDALQERGMTIVSMLTAVPAVTLKVPAVADRMEAIALADDLASTFAFLAVTHSIAPGNPMDVSSQGKGQFGQSPFAGGVQTFMSDQLAAMHMPAARNADGLNDGNPTPRVPVLVPDYYSTETDSRFTAQIPVAGNGSVIDGPVGNRGYQLLGVIGIDDTLTQFDPVLRGADEKVYLASLPIFGFTYLEMIAEIGRALEQVSLAFGDEQMILCTGLTYGQGDFGIRSPFWRAYDAGLWRCVTRSISHDFIHVTAAGDLGQENDVASDAIWSSPYNLSKAFPDLSDVLSTYAPEDLLAFTLLWGTNPPGPLGNLRSVGSSEPLAYSPSDFSSDLADLRVVGEDIVTACNQMSGTCDGSTETVSSTRVAAAEVAGLFAYLRSLSPTRSTEDLLDLVDRAWFGGYAPGVVDAYFATLGLDLSLADPRVRLEILDVAGNSPVFDGTENGIFDENDLQVFLNGFSSPSALRFDLNGNGVAGGSGTSQFDLEVNSPPRFEFVSELAEGASLGFDEASVTDLEILCYYAYSPLYLGDSTLRRDLLADCTGVQDTPIVFVASSQRTFADSAKAESDVDSDLKMDLTSFPFNGSDFAVAEAGTGDNTSGTSCNASWTSSFSNAGPDGSLTTVNNDMSSSVFFFIPDSASSGSHAASVTWTQSSYISVKSGEVVDTDFVMNYSISLEADSVITVDVQIGSLLSCFTLDPSDARIGSVVLSGPLSGPSNLFKLNVCLSNSNTTTTESTGLMDWDSTLTLVPVPN